MKIAVISDIHGNMEAINAVFEDIKHQNCEKISFKRFHFPFLCVII